MKSVYRNYDKSSSSLPTGVGTYSGAVVSFAASELMPIATGSAAAVGLSERTLSNGLLVRIAW